MPFSDALKESVKWRAHFTCCWCRDVRNKVEIHHIKPESENGPDIDANAAPLCSNCHTLYGGNPDLRKEITLRRDQWYELCATNGLPPKNARHAQSNLAPDLNRTHHLANPLHRIIDLLIKYHSAFGRVHQAKTIEALDTSLDEWRSCHPAVWGSSAVRDDTIRNLADPAKEWLAQIKSSYIQSEDFNLVEEGAYVLSAFAISASPMAMPDVYSKAYSTEDELWQRWRSQGDRYMALGGLTTRLKELAARAGQRWNPSSLEG